MSLFISGCSWCSFVNISGWKKTGNVWINIILMCVCLPTVAVGKHWVLYIASFCVFVWNFSYPACNLHAPQYIVKWPTCLALPYFPTLSKKVTIFRKKRLEKHGFDCLFFTISMQNFFKYINYIPLHVWSTIVLIFRRSIILLQHLVSSLSLGDCSVHRLREDVSPLVTCVLNSHPKTVTIPDAVLIQLSSWRWA